MKTRFFNLEADKIMKIKYFFTPGLGFFILFLLLCTNSSFAGLLGPSNYNDCISAVVKNARTESAVQLGVQNCGVQFSNQEAKIKDCSLTWNGVSFLKGVPEVIVNYTNIGIKNTTHQLYLPLDMSKEAMGEIIKKNFSKIRKICPITE